MTFFETAGSQVTKQCCHDDFEPVSSVLKFVRTVTPYEIFNITTSKGVQKAWEGAINHLNPEV